MQRPNRAIRLIAYVLGLAMLTAFPAPGHGTDVETGVEAYQQAAYARAWDILRPLAEAGDAEAEYYVGLMWRDGQGRRADPRVAAHWLRLAARQGHHEALIALDRLLSKHWPAAPDYRAVSTWLHRLAEDGDAHAQLQLGLLYRDGQVGREYGIPHDLAEAGGWFLLAAEQGLAEAQVDMGRLYDRRSRFSSYTFGGQIAEDVEMGPPEDLVEAYKWYSLAAAQGHPEAAQLRDALQPHLTPEQVVQAIERIREQPDAPPR